MSQPEVRPLTRVAFLISNHQYAKKGWNFWSDLPNSSDEHPVSGLLEKMNFECRDQRRNATAHDLQQLPGRLANRLRGTHGALALIHFGGHGMTYRGKLYLIPTDYVEDLPGRYSQSLASLFLIVLPNLFYFVDFHGIMSAAGATVLLVGLIAWIFPALWFLRVLWQKLTGHPLSNAYCFDDLEAELANIHVTHAASNTVFFFVLDCCRDFGHLSLWHRFLLRWLHDPPAVKRSNRSSRPHFFKTFACEEGRCALGSPGGYMSQAFLDALGSMKPGATLDQLLTAMDEKLRKLCLPGLQKMCIYSTSHRLAKQVIFWGCSDVVATGPTLLTSMRKGRLLDLKPSEWHLFQRHRNSRDPQERKQILFVPTLSHDLHALLLLRSLAEKKSFRGARGLLTTSDAVKAIRQRGLKPRNVKLVLCELNLMQAKFLCDKSLAVLCHIILGKSEAYERCLASVDRKIGRVEILLSKVASVLDHHTIQPYLRGRAGASASGVHDHPLGIFSNKQLSVLAITDVHCMLTPKGPWCMMPRG